MNINRLFFLAMAMLIVFAGTANAANITVADGETLKLNNSADNITVEAGGNLVIESSGGLNGILVNYGNVVVEAGFVFTSFSLECDIENHGYFYNNGVLNDIGSFNNSGYFYNYGEFSDSSRFYNIGNFENHGQIRGLLPIENDGTFINYGEIDLAVAPASLENNVNGSFYNYNMIYFEGTIKNYGIINNEGHLFGVITFENYGTLINNGRIKDYGGGPIIFENYGTLTNNDAITVERMMFYNYGELINNGDFGSEGFNAISSLITYKDSILVNNGMIRADIITEPTQNIPEFPTIAIPLAAIIGVAFMFQRRKR